MGFNIKTAILRQIVKAQIASDAAKGIKIPEYSKFQGFEGIWSLQKYAAYTAKDKAIKKALSLIDSVPPCGIHYYVERKADQNGNGSNVVYFNIKINGTRFQISFHNFRREIRVKYAEPQKGMQCHWEGGIGGSREATAKIINLYFSGQKH